MKKGHENKIRVIVGLSFIFLVISSAKLDSRLPSRVDMDVLEGITRIPGIHDVNVLSSAGTDVDPRIVTNVALGNVAVLYPAAGSWILRLPHGYAPALKCLARIGASHLAKVRLEKLFNIFDKISSPSLSEYSDNFEKRKLLQKQIYLLQELGLNLGYFFKWFAYGPYSEDLSEDIHEVLLRREMQKPLTSSKPFTQSEIQVIDQILQINKELLIEGISLPEMYEILASIQFIYSRFPNRFDKSTDVKAELVSNLLSIKSELNHVVSSSKDLVFKVLNDHRLVKIS